MLARMATEMMSTAKAAAELNVHRSTLTRMVQAGKIKPAYRGEGPRGEMAFYPSEIRKARRLLTSHGTDTEQVAS